jgi:hypothetical protein
VIALVTTYFLVFYVLVPGVLFRFVTSLFVRLKIFQRTRSQEAAFAVAVSILPFAVALFGVWEMPVMRHHPFAIHEGTNAERRMDYRRVITILTSSDASRFLNLASPSDSNAPNWSSLNRVLRRQARFLSWFFAATACEGLLFVWLVGKYGDWQQPGSSGQSALLIRAYGWAARKFILPHISEWHMLLTDFNLPRKDDLFVAADILQSDGNLYRGRVVDYFIDAEGKLTGILLKDVYRYEREAHEAAKKASNTPEAVVSDPYWRLIPSTNFYIGQGSISNLNLRFAPRRDETLRNLANKVLQEEDIQADEIAVTSDSEAQGLNPESSLHDLYS